MINTPTIQTYSINTVHLRNIKKSKPKTNEPARRFGFPSVYLCDVKINGKELNFPLFSFDYYHVHYNVIICKDDFS